MCEIKILIIESAMHAALMTVVKNLQCLQITSQNSTTSGKKPARRSLPANFTGEAPPQSLSNKAV